MKLSIAGPLLLSLPLAQAASIRGSRHLADDCGVTSFSYYTPGDAYEITMPLYGGLDLTDMPDGKVNIIANVGEPCGDKPIKCVKISFAGSTRNERKAPFALYGDRPRKQYFNVRRPRESGVQLLEAWTYTDKECSEGESGYLSQEVDVIPGDEPLEGTVVLDTFVVAYDGTLGPATEDETDSAGQTTCKFFNDAIGYGFIYKADISLTDFICNYSMVDGDDPLAIEFDISASFRKWTGFNPYTNRRLPTVEEVTTFVGGLVEDNWTIGPSAPGLLSDSYIQGLSGSPYASATGFSLV